MLDRNCLAYLFSVTGWELCREQRDPLLKPEANSDEANSLTTLLATGSESSACEWCISTPTTMLVSNTQSIFTFTNCPITPFKAMPHSPTPLQHFFILEEDKKAFKKLPQMTFLYVSLVWTESLVHGGTGTVAQANGWQRRMGFPGLVLTCGDLSHEPAGGATFSSHVLLTWHLIKENKK